MLSNMVGSRGHAGVCITASFMFFPESERTGPPVGGRPHSTAGYGGALTWRALAGARDDTDDVAELLTKCLIQANQAVNALSAEGAVRLRLLSVAIRTGSQRAVSRRSS